MSNPTEQASKKKRAPRAKKQPQTKEETLKLLQDALDELKQIVIDLKEDEVKLSGLSLKKIPELLQKTFVSLEDDIKEVQDKYDAIFNYKEGEK